MAAVTVRVETFVPAPLEKVYAAMLDPETHARTASGRERVVGVRRSEATLGSTPDPSPFSSRSTQSEFDKLEPRKNKEGSLRLGDEVTFEATHFGVRQRLTARISAVDPPRSFEDVQVRGFFRSLTHRHEFLPEGEGTRMVDEMTFASPLGGLFDRLVLGPYLRRFLARRGEALAFLCRVDW